MEKNFLEHNDLLLVSYSCAFSEKNKIVGFELVLEDPENLSKYQIYSELWSCANKNTKLNSFSNFKKIVAKFPQELRFRPDFLTTSYYYHTAIKIRAWMLDVSEFKRLKKLNLITSAFDNSRIKTEISAKLLDPFSRPSKLTRSCLSFGYEILYKYELKNIYFCNIEEGYIQQKKLQMIVIILNKKFAI